MIIGDIKHIKIARKYSDALLDSAIEAKVSDKVFGDLLFISETINANKELENVFLNPVVSLSDKKEIARKIFTVHIDKITLDFILLLIDNNRLNILNEVVNQYSKSYNELNNISKPVVISAIELKENQKNRIAEKLEKKLAKKVVPQYLVNPDIVGGLIFEIEDRTIDCSLKTKFDNMRKQLTKGNRYGNN